MMICHNTTKKLKVTVCLNILEGYLECYFVHIEYTVKASYIDVACGLSPYNALFLTFYHAILPITCVMLPLQYPTFIALVVKHVVLPCRISALLALL